MAKLQEERSMLELGGGPKGPFVVDANLVATGRTCVLGASGSGKSYAVGVLCEELCRNGVPFAIIDTEGEHTGLKEKFEAVWVGEERGSDVTWEGLDLGDLAKQAPDIPPLIMDVSDLANPKERVSAFVTALYETLTERRTPYLIVVEEADKFVPQLGERVPIFAEVARRGRKRGMGLMVCSQRPSLVDKNVLSQCGNQLIGKLIIQNDLKSVAQFFSGKGLPKGLTSLKAGQFFAMGGFSPEPELIAMRSRATRPGGVTPTLGKRVVKSYLGKTGPRPPSGGQAGAPEEGEKTMPGLAPSIGADDVPIIVRRERSFGIFGPKETVTGVIPEFRSMVQLGVRLRRGLLKRRFETAYLYLDGITGRRVSLGKGLDLSRGFEKILGLTTLQVEVLRELGPDVDTSSLDVASALGEAKSTASRALGILADKRLVRTVEVRGKKLFRRMVDLPGEPSAVVPLELEGVSVGGSRVVPPKVRESDIRDAVKGLWEGADVDSFEPFVYPVFRVELVARRKRRAVLVDGRSGKELDF